MFSVGSSQSEKPRGPSSQWTVLLEKGICPWLLGDSQVPDRDPSPPQFSKGVFITSRRRLPWLSLTFDLYSPSSWRLWHPSPCGQEGYTRGGIQSQGKSCWWRQSVWERAGSCAVLGRHLWSHTEVVLASKVQTLGWLLEP